MKTKQLIAILCGIICILPNCSCSLFAKSKVLAEPAKAEQLDWKEHRNEGFMAFKVKANAFAAKFASTTYTSQNAQTNFAVSPVSVFMALGMAAECSLGETQREILNALGVTQTELHEYYATLYRSLNVEYKSVNALQQKKTTGMLTLSNSIWLDDSLPAKEACLDTLSNRYYTYVHAVDFDGKNQNANDAIKNFINKQTKGLIKRDFHLSEQTLFTLINTLYLKDLWNYDGDDLQRTQENIPFTNSFGKTQNERFLQGYYITGRAYETDSFYGYYTSTYHGYKIKFLVPKDGYTAQDIFTENNLNDFNAVTDFDAEDEENLIRYHTRCIFPEYKGEFNGDVKEILQQQFGLQTLFNEETCDFTALTDTKPAYCGGVIHQTSLEVNRKGIEGSAITVIPGAGAPGPDEYENVYVDFLVNKGFGFLLTDPHNTVIFSGVIENI